MVAIFLSCASYSKLKTTSGKPEILIMGTTEKEVFNTIVNDIVNKGYSIEQIENYAFISFTRNQKCGFLEELNRGGCAGETDRIRFSLIAQETTIRIYVSIHRTYRGRYIECNRGKGMLQIQEYLEELKAKLEK